MKNKPKRKQNWFKLKFKKHPYICFLIAWIISLALTYIFAEISGYSKFGSYTGNANADGTFIYTGFKPMYFMLKSSTDGESWSIYDVKRQTYNPVTYYFPAANLANAESSSSSYAIDFLSNGVKMRGSGDGINKSGATYVYMAFAEAPFVNSNGVPCNAR